MATVIQKVLKLSKVEYYQVHLMLVNAVLPANAKLTEKELQVLAMFMSFDEDIAMGRFGTYARSIVKEKLGIQTAGLSNYLKFLKDKRFILEGENGLKFVPLIQIPNTEQSYMFKIINKEI